jgi:ABC-type Co2+ transport system permease subunit
MTLLWGFCAGFGGVALAAALTSSALLLSGGDFHRAGALLFLAHIPVMFVEGLATAFIAVSLKRLRPETFACPGHQVKNTTETQAP